MNLLSFLPTLVSLDPALTKFLGTFGDLVVTVLNGMAYLIIILLVARLSLISIRALLEFNDPATKHAEIMTGAIRSGVESFLIAVIGFLVIAAGPNLLYYLASSATTGLFAKETDYLPQFAGAFSKVVAAAQNIVSLGVVILGVFLAGKIWYGALAKTNYTRGGEGTKTEMTTLQEAAKRTAVLTLLVILAFATVLKGPQLFFSIIHGASSVINTPVVP